MTAADTTAAKPRDWDLAFLIDPADHTGTFVMLPRADRLAHIYELLGCDLIDAAYLDNGHAIYVDDEGLYRDPVLLFRVTNYPNPLAGRGLLVGPVDEDGETTDVTLTAKWLGENIWFRQPPLEGEGVERKRAGT